MKTLVLLCLAIGLISCDSSTANTTNTSEKIELNEPDKRILRSVSISGPDSFLCGRTKSYTVSSSIEGHSWKLKRGSRTVKRSNSSTFSYRFAGNYHGSYKLYFSGYTVHPKTGELTPYSGSKSIRVRLDPSRHY